MAAKRKKSNLKQARRRKIISNILSGLAEGLSVTEVCACNEISRQTYYHWKETDPVFAHQIEHTYDARASFIDMVLWHAACRANGDPRYIPAATSYLRIHELREKRKDQQRRWEAEQQRWQAEQARWEAEHARWQAEQARWEAEQKEAEQKQQEAREQSRASEAHPTETSPSRAKRTKAAHSPLRSRPKRVRLTRRRHTPPLPPKWVRRHLPELTSAFLAANSAPDHLTATPIAGDGTTLPEPIPIPQPAS